MVFQSLVSTLGAASTNQNPILQGLKKITDEITSWMIPIAAVGTVSMAILQAIKNQTPSRNWYQKNRLRVWLIASIRGNYCKGWLTRARHAFALRFPSSKDEKRKREIEATLQSQLDCLSRIENDLIALATSGDKEAFYDLPIDGLCDQIRKIVPVIIDYPPLHKELLCVLARGASASDLQLLFEPQRLGSMEQGDSTQPSADQSEVQLSKEHAAKTLRQITAAKGRVLTQIRCSIDAMQISISFRWKFLLQTTAMLLSAVIGGLAFAWRGGPLDPDSATRWDIVWRSVGFGALAGFLSPIARDLIAATEKWRT